MDSPFLQEIMSSYLDENKNAMVVVADPSQLEKFAADPSFSDAAIPTATRFVSTNGTYEDWLMRSHVGTFRITGYDQATSMLTIRKMHGKERIALWLKETASSLTKFGRRFRRKIASTLRSLVNF